MITMQQWMEIVNYKITEGSDYQWSSFGNKAYSLDSWNQEQDGHSLCIIFDTDSQIVYQVQVCDYARNNAYRYTNPDYYKSFLEEVKQRKNHDQAWDDVRWVDLEESSDWLKKASAIVKNQEYDTRVSFPIDLDDRELMQLMLLAHEHDITLNKMVEKILIEVIDKEKNK